MSATTVGNRQHTVIAKFSFCEPELDSPVSASQFSSTMCRKETVQSIQTAHYLQTSCMLA